MFILLRKILLFLSFLVFISVTTNTVALGQEAVKTKIEQLVDVKQKQAKENQKKVELERSAANELQSSKVDTSLNTASETGNPEELFQLEKENFKIRNQVVKRRYPERSSSYSESDWQNELLLSEDRVYKKEHILDSTSQVFGWHPFWMGNAYKSYNFSLLSTVAYFSYELNPENGKYFSIHEWSTTSLIDSAHAHGCKVVLSVTNFGSRNNSLFLSNINAQKTFINTLITLLRERNADGVNIDFEGISGNDRNALTNFIIDLSESLKSANKDYLVTIALPAFDFDKVYDIRNIGQYVDLFIIMGYEFHGATSKVAGPIAPLASGTLWWEFNLDRSVKEYVLGGIAANKLIMGLPYYGAEWQTEDLIFPSKVKRFIKYPMYRNIKDTYGKTSCCEDEISGSRFYVYRDNENNYRQIWYEDSASLAKKYDWVKKKKLGGIGIWALGYDNGYTELWELIAEKFAVKPELEAKIATASIKAPSGNRLFGLVMRLIRNPRSLITNPRPLIGMFGAMFGVSVAGFLLIWRYGYRLRRVSKLLLQSTLTLFIVIAVALIFLGLKYLALKEVAYLIGGFVFGCLIFFIYSRHFLSEKELP
jgi:spore germination protein